MRVVTNAARVLRPLRARDFALLWSGMTVSLLGDGIFTVALAWQVYELSDAPTALSAVGVAWTLPQIGVLLFGGAVADRLERRLVLVAADLVRGLAVTAVGVLAVGDALELWHLFALAAVFGTSSAFFGPAFTAFVPELVSRDELVEANALEQVVRPVAVRFAGPALGGWLIAEFGVAAAFLLDGASFLVSIAALLLVRARPEQRAPAGGGRRSVFGDVGEGLRYVRSQPWLWVTFGAVAVSMLFFLGPVYVLLPYIVKHTLGGSATDLGLVFAAGGIGAVGASLIVGSRGLPRRHISVVYGAWVLSTAGLAGYALANALWQVIVVSLAATALLITGEIVWSTLLQRLVPSDLLGRVSSVDWLLSFGLAPLSYALTGPVAAAIGVDATLLGAGLVGGGVLLAAYLVFPRVRAIERTDPAAVPA